jgi:ATP-binding cassette subfamily F protein uup
LAAARPSAVVTTVPASAPGAKPTPGAVPRKLSFKEQRELQDMPARIEALEAEQRTIGERLGSASLYTDEPQRVGELQARFAQIDDELLQALERWEALSAR